MRNFLLINMINPKSAHTDCTDLFIYRNELLMESFFYAVSLLTAGVSLSTGMINLFIGIYKGVEKTDVIFGVMGISLFIFLLMPPVGFILHDAAPYPVEIEIKRIFIWGYYALMPWFIEYYTGYKRRIFAIIINVLCGASYLMMILTATDSMKPAWTMVAIIVFGLILLYGVIASVRQIKSNRQKEGKWLLAAMIIYGMLFIATAFNQLGNNYLGNILGTKLFYPFHFNALAFMVIMGIRLRANTYEKYRLEKILRWRDIQWNSLVQNMQLIIIQLDKDGKITYLNRYAVKALGYASDKELLNRNWFKYCLPPHESAFAKAVFEEVIKEQQEIPFLKNRIKVKDGKERIINWTNVLVYDGNGRPEGMVGIGADITEQEKAIEQIKTLKIELEKESFQPRLENLPEKSKQGIIGNSETIVYAIQKAKQVAETNATVLLEGETGVGKELFADFIHKCSLRSNKPIVKINCAALPAELIESELFGHEKGAFTGALQMHKGKFELANGGTIFLDEIGELPLPLQPKLLRVLQNGEFQRIGSQQTIKVDVRIISATNRDLHKAVKEGTFREDLYYRLDVFPVTIPALRNRKEDIPDLVAHFVHKFVQEHGKQVENISRADLDRLTNYLWPGNVRELINVIERSVILTQGKTLKLDWFNAIDLPGDTAAAVAIEEVERLHIVKVLRECGWKINGDDGAAVKLGLHPSTLRSRMKKLNIVRAEV